MKKVALHNLGCKVNAYETEAMQELLENNGYEIVTFKEGADIYIINTCTVTNMADRKSRQMLHKAKKMNPEAIVIAAGCYVQTKEEEIDECIDIVLGNNKKKDLIQVLETYYNSDLDFENQDTVIDINNTKEYESLKVTKTKGHTRAYLKVQDGCNQFCTYCIIPFARGRVRSRRIEDVIEEVTALAKNDYKEVVLTGIHLSSYGVDFEKKETLLTLIEAVHKIKGIERIRLGSLEPRIITEEFVIALSKLEKVCPHFHLSLQSGCDETLKRMNRKYDTKAYMESCELLRKYFENPALTTDIIVGFPGETDEEFQQTKEFVSKIGFYETHVFKYSKREGTKAASMADQVTDQLKASRSSVLLKLNDEKQKEYERSFDGKKVSVLLEEKIKVNGEEYLCGYTKEYIKIGVLPKDYKANQIIEVKIGEETQIIH